MRWLVLSCLALAATPVWGQNLLVNGDFDTGAIDPWVAFEIPPAARPDLTMGKPVVNAGGGVFVPVPPTTSGAYRLARSFGGNLAGGDCGAYQEVAVTPGQFYILTGDVAGGVGRPDELFNGAAIIEVRVLDGSWDPSRINEAELVFNWTFHINGNLNWTHFSKGLIFASPTVTVFVRYSAQDDEWSWHPFGAYFDSLSLTEGSACVQPSDITGVSPDSLSAPPDPGVRQMTFSGTHLDLLTSVALQHESGYPTLTGVIQSQTASEIVAEFNFTGASLGRYMAIGVRDDDCPNALRPQAFELACSSPATTLATIVGDRGPAGTAHTILITGQNLAAVTGVKLVKLRHNDGPWPGSAGNPIVGTGLTMAGDGLQVTFDLTDAEAGWYSVVCSHPCGLVNNEAFRKGFLVYLPELANASFEEDYFGNVGEDPCNGGGRNKPKPKHWDVGIDSGDGSYSRDGDIFHPVCDNTHTKGIDGKHYATRQMARTSADSDSIFQTIAAPAIERFNIRANFAILGGTVSASNTARIVLHDGSDADPVIAEVVIPSAWETDPTQDGLVADPAYNVEVPAGYVYLSDPPLLTIEIRFENAGAGVNGFHGFAVDHVRTGPFVDLGCNLEMWADSDGDRDVDADDFGHFQRCYTGRIGSIPTLPGYPCVCFDRQGDGWIDEADYAEFQNCVSGPSVPWSSSAAPLCNP